MSILNTLSNLGIPATLYGNDPTNEDEYLVRVVAGDGFDLPSWASLDAARLSSAKAQKVAEAWRVMQSRVALATVEVVTSAGTHTYGIDATTQDNLQKALLGMIASLTPNPRPWTPKGMTAPVMLTHDDVRLVAGQVGATYDAFVQAYLAHKAVISGLADLIAVAAYDLNQSWPS